MRKRSWKRIAGICAGALAGLVLLFVLINWPIQSRHTASAKIEPGDRAVEVPGGTLNVSVEGHGPPILLIHGWRGSRHWWDGVAPALVRRFTVIRPDLLGFGESDKPCPGYGMNQQAERMVALLDALKVKRAQVVGHSMGGVIAAAMAERHPERVASLTIVGSPAAPAQLHHDALQSATMWPAIGPALETLTLKPFVRQNLEKTAFAPGTHVPDRLVEDAVKPTWCSSAHSSRRTRAFLDQATLAKRLAGYRGRTLAIYGARDKLVDTAGAVATMGALPGVRVRVLAQAAHPPMLDQPREFVAVLKPFLERTRSR